MWLCENRLKGKTARFRLPSASQTCVLKLPRELNHATFLSQGWKPELNISHARTGIFKAIASTSEKILHNTNVVV